MSKYSKALRLFLVLILGVFFLVGCGEDKPTKDDTRTDTASQNEGSSNTETNQNSDNSTENETNQNDNSSSSIYTDKTEQHKTYAERKLIIPITAPFELRDYIVIIKNFEHTQKKYAISNKKITYSPKAGFIGLDTITIKVEDESRKNSIQITYNIEVEEQPLEGFRDFIINYNCENRVKQFGSYVSLDLDIMNNNFERQVKVYDDFKGSQPIPYPGVSRIQVDYFNATKEERIVNHHKYFKENLEHHVLLTCNHRNGYSSLLYPIASKNWKSVKSVNNGYTGVNYHFIRNDLYFYISSLSDLHSKIYLKEYQKSYDSNSAFKNADSFMNKVFPDSHYTAEHVSQYDIRTYNDLRRILDKDNQRYYTMLGALADEVTNGSVTLLLEEIAKNYDSYYLSSNKKCLNKTICGALFPEYTVSLTNDPSFKEGLTKWTEHKEVDTLSSNGKIEYLPTKKQVSIDFTANIPASSSIPVATIDLFQQHTIDGNNLDNYFLNFDLAHAYGGSNGHFGLAGVKSSGLAGTYACYKDMNNETLGCLTWTDYTNIAKFIWTPTNEGLSFDFYRLHSNETFYNTELKETFRRSDPPKERMLYSTNLGEFTNTLVKKS